MADRELRTYRLTDLGCKVNQYETQLIAERLEGAGLRPAAEGQSADLCLVNSCAVTSAAAAKSARAVRQLRRRNPGALVVVAGCAVSAAGKDDILGRTGADLALAQDEKLDLPGLPQAPGPAGHISRFEGHCRAFMKIQDGCDSFCAYCIVPRLRGAPRSRPLDEIRAEARALEAGGHRELVLSGVHLGLYGRDIEGKPSLADAARAMLGAAPRARLRISSLDPAELSDELLELVASERRVCSHLHLPLQSGDDGVLGAMRRHYTSAEFLRVVAKVRARLDRPGITTDVMAGFPGESAAAFKNTLDLCRRAAFSRMHVFPFSAREGTDAARLPDQVPAEVAKRRAAELVELGAELAAGFAAGCVGGTEEVLAEELLDNGTTAGYSARYMRTYFTCEDSRLREIYRVKIERAEGPDLYGSVVA